MRGGPGAVLSDAVRLSPEVLARELVDGLPRLVPVKQAAEALSVSVRTLKRWVADGRLRVCKPNGQSGRMLIPRPEIERLLRVTLV